MSLMRGRWSLRYLRSKYGNFSPELELGCGWVGEARVSNLDLLHVDFICYGMRVDDVGTNEFVSAECGTGRAGYV